VYRNLHGTNIIAPIDKNPTGILDVGTGSGRWAAEVADTYPRATVWGLDLSPPRVFGTPPNCQFLVGDLTKRLNFDDGSLDLVHSRYVLRMKVLN
jgi:ubiquinone/menaquinone biosynthesis C-methylase UbiE